MPTSCSNDVSPPSALWATVTGKCARSICWVWRVPRAAISRAAPAGSMRDWRWRARSETKILKPPCSIISATWRTTRESTIAPRSIIARGSTFCERSGDSAGAVVSQQNLGRVLLRQGQRDRAGDYLLSSLHGAWRLRDLRRIAEGLEGLAARAGALGEAERAARLLGAADRQREELGTPMSAPERADITAIVAGAQTHLGVRRMGARIHCWL